MIKAAAGTIPTMLAAVIKDELLFVPQYATGAAMIYAITEATTRIVAHAKHPPPIRKERFHEHVMNKWFCSLLCSLIVSTEVSMLKVALNKR